MRALTVSIYGDKRLGNCSNHGISEKYREVLLICNDGNIEIDPDNQPENLCKLVEREVFGRKYMHIEPVAKPEGAGWMYGGSICYTGDGRFRRMSEYPLCLHDRQETWEQYDKLSR